MNDPLYQIRVYGQPDDGQLISSWRQGHGMDASPLSILPPTGFFVERDGEPVCVAFLYLSVGIGVAFMEWVISKPGMTYKESAAAFRVLLDFLKLHAASLDYGVIISHTSPGGGEFLRRCGFVSQGKKESMMCQTREEPE
jgi:hypothetical protein